MNEPRPKLVFNVAPAVNSSGAVSPAARAIASSTPVTTARKRRGGGATHLPLPYSTSQTATPMPIGTAITDASATISTVPRIALLIPPMLELLKKVLPVGSVVKKLELHEPRPLSSGD